MYSAGFMYSQIPMIPVTLDYMFPLNYTREKMLAIPGDYIFDPFEYYYELYLLGMLICPSLVSIFVSVDSIYVMNVHQCLGMLSIVM